MRFDFESVAVACAALSMVAMTTRPVHAGDPVGDEFQVNSHSDGAQGQQGATRVAVGDDGGFVVVWESDGQLDGADVYGQRFDAAGNPVGGEFRINEFTAGGQYNPRVAMNADGTLVAVWSDNTQHPEHAISAQRYQADGSPDGGEIEVTDGFAQPPLAASLSLADDGRFVVAWQQAARDGNGRGVFGQRFDEDGAHVGSVFPINETTEGNQFEPDVDYAADGSSFAVAWASVNLAGDPALGIALRIYEEDGSPRTGEIHVNEQTDGTQRFPVVALNSVAGQVVVAWATQGGGSGTPFDISARRFDLDGSPLGEEFTVNTTGSVDDGNASREMRPRVALADDGRLVFAWETDSDGGDDDGLRGRSLAPGCGGDVDGDYPINSSTAGDQNIGGLGMSASGVHQVVVWGDGSGQDGDGWGVFAQRFMGHAAGSLPMDCFAANCLKVTLGSGMGDGKITAQGALAARRCPAGDPDAELDPPLGPDDQVELRLDGVLVFSEPLSAFDRRGEQYKFRGAAGGMQLDLARRSWKFVDRRSDVSLAGGLDPEDGVHVELGIGMQVGSEQLAVDYDPVRALAKACRHGRDKVDCP